VNAVWKPAFNLSERSICSHGTQQLLFAVTLVFLQLFHFLATSYAIGYYQIAARTFNPIHQMNAVLSTCGVASTTTSVLSSSSSSRIFTCLTPRSTRRTACGEGNRWGEEGRRVQRAKKLPEIRSVHKTLVTSKIKHLQKCFRAVDFPRLCRARKML